MSLVLWPNQKLHFNLNMNDTLSHRIKNYSFQNILKESFRIFMDGSLKVSVFELQLHFYIPFWTDT